MHSLLSINLYLSPFGLKYWHNPHSFPFIIYKVLSQVGLHTPLGTNKYSPLGHVVEELHLFPSVSNKTLEPLLHLSIQLLPFLIAHIIYADVPITASIELSEYGIKSIRFSSVLNITLFNLISNIP